MNKVTRFTYWLALYIVAIFTFAMFATYFSEYLQHSGFFGDTIQAFKDNDAADRTHDWGVRHYWYQVMCMLLFALSLVRIVIWAINFWEEKPA